MKPMAALWRLALSAGLAGVLTILVVNIITQPVAEEKHSYAAEFTDASGLHIDADVRVRGVRVGKVSSVELERRQDQSVAKVAFTLDKRYGVVGATHLAIKYQALTGVRYIDVVDSSERYSPGDLVTNVPTTMTQPSFDITALFNGLQPVIATLSPDELNAFTENAVSYLTGDGGGLAPMLDSIRKLTEFLSNREEVVATLLRNLSDVSDTLGGHSKDLTYILDQANKPLDGVLLVLDEFRKSLLFGYEFTHSVTVLLHNAGFKFGADLDKGLDRALSNVDDFIESFKLVPVMWDNVPPPSGEGAPVPCSKGRFQLPESMDVLVNGQRVVLCNR